MFILIFSSTVSIASQSHNFNSNADFDFEIDYPSDKNGERHGVLIFRRKLISKTNQNQITEYGPWEVADSTSWNEWSKKQKCSLHRQVKRKHRYFWGRNFSCDDFMALMSKRIDPDEYIGVGTLDIPRLVGFVAGLNDELKALDGSALAGGYCQKPEPIRNEIENSTSKIGLLPPLPLNRRASVIVTKGNFCRYEDLSKRKEEFIKGYKGDFSLFFNQLKNEFYVSFRGGLNLVIPTSYAMDLMDTPQFQYGHNDFPPPIDSSLEGLGGGFGSIDNAAVSDVISETINNQPLAVKDSTFSDDLIQQFKDDNFSNVSEAMSLVKGDLSACSDDGCVKKLMSSRLEELRDCDRKREKQFTDVMAQGEARYGKDTPEFEKFEAEMNALMEESRKDFQATISTVETASQTGQRQGVDKMIQDNDGRIIEGNDSRMRENRAYNEDLKIRQSEIRAKQERGEELTREERETLDEKATVTTNIVNRETGEVEDTVTKTVDEYYNLDSAVAAESGKDRKFESSVVDFSNYNDKPSSEKVEAIAARVMLEAQRRGENMSIVTANEIAKKYAKESKPIIDFDSLFKKSASAPATEEERQILAQSLSANRSASKAALIQDVLKGGNIDPAATKQLEAAYKVAQRKHEIKQSFIDGRIKENPKLGEPFKERDYFPPTPPKPQPPQQRGDKLAGGNLSPGGSNGGKQAIRTPRNYNPPSPPAGGGGANFNPGSPGGGSSGAGSGGSPMGGNQDHNYEDFGETDNASQNNPKSDSSASSVASSKANGSKENSSQGSTGDAQSSNTTEAKSSSASKGTSPNRGPASIESEDSNGPELKDKKDYEKLMHAMTGEGIDKLGKATLKSYLEKYLSDKTVDVAILKEELFDESKEIVQYTISAAIFSSGYKDHFYIQEKNNGDHSEMMVYDFKHSFSPKRQGPITTRLKKSGKLEFIQNLDIFDKRYSQVSK